MSSRSHDFVNCVPATPDMYYSGRQESMALYDRRPFFLTFVTRIFLTINSRSGDLPQQPTTPDTTLAATAAAMRNFILGAPRLVRVDPVHPPRSIPRSLAPSLPRSTSAADLAHAKAAKPVRSGLQRCASAEGSAGWVTQEDYLAHRHSTKRLRALPIFPKLMSSWEFERAETDASSGAPMDATYCPAEGGDVERLEQNVVAGGSVDGAWSHMDTDSQFSPLSPDTSSAAFTPTSSSLRASSWSSTSGVPWREAGPPNHHDDKVDSDQ